jgi:hypothetical protein
MFSLLGPELYQLILWYLCPRIIILSMCWVFLCVTGSRCDKIVPRICDVFLFLYWQWLFCDYHQYQCQWSLIEDTSWMLNFYVSALHFLKILSATCEIMVLRVLHSETILLLSEISCIFCWFFFSCSHCILSTLGNLIL